MKIKTMQVFAITAGVILLLVAVAKFVSASGSSHILKTRDPALGIQYDHLFIIVGACELSVAIICFLSRDVVLKSILIAWLGTMFLIYRCSLLFVDWSKPCSCLGTVTQALHIRPQTADTAMKIILAYLLIGSYAILFLLWRKRHKNVASASVFTLTQ